MVTNLTLNGMNLLAGGIIIENATPKDQLKSLINKLHPVQTEIPLIRMGSEHDGGYLIPNDLEGIEICYSPGVSDNASFESGLLKYNIESHLADYSVENPPNNIHTRSFTKKFLGSRNTTTHMTLDHWVSTTESLQTAGDYILQMDIEGAEYLSILVTNQETLSKFRIIVLEIHYVEQWAFPPYFQVVESMIDKLLADFHVVHSHPNSWGGLVNVNGIVCPRLFELTLLRKDRSAPKDFAKKFPHPLDRSNLRDRPDLPLPVDWYGGH